MWIFFCPVLFRFNRTKETFQWGALALLYFSVFFNGLQECVSVSEQTQGLQVQRDYFVLAKSPQMATQGSIPSLYDISKWLVKRGFISRGAFNVRTIPNEEYLPFSAVLCGYSICQSHIPIPTHGTSFLHCPGLLGTHLNGLSLGYWQWHLEPVSI